jgi:hypothetical protein
MISEVDIRDWDQYEKAIDKFAKYPNKGEKRVESLTDRMERGVLKGSGDER